jgi:proline iminopeptidase
VRFQAGVPGAGRDRCLAEAYSVLLLDPDPAVHEAAARAWCAWEDAVSGTANARYRDPRFRLGFARLVTHYWRHAAFLPDGALLDGIARIADIPAVLVQGALDPAASLGIAQALAARWPGSELVTLPGAGHAAGRDLTAALAAATSRYLPPRTSRR